MTIPAMPGSSRRICSAPVCASQCCVSKMARIFWTSCFPASPPARQPATAYLLLLDIHMPRVDGVQVLSQVKADPHLRKMPVIMLTTTDDPREVARCHQLGCNHYMVKPVNYDRFSEAIIQLGHFINLVQVPGLDGPKSD